MSTIGDILRKHREKKFPGRGGVTVCAEAFGISPQYWRDWETAKRRPGARNQQKLALFFGITVAELVGERSVSGSPERRFQASPLPPRGIPVIGLAECGVSGWYVARPIAVHASLPTHERMFAVIAVGSSMIPDGIHEGNLAYCDPTIQPREGDAIFLKTTDGKASLKRFLKWENGWLHVLGWLDPERSGGQKPFYSEFQQDFIETVCCVVMVQRRV